MKGLDYFSQFFNYLIELVARLVVVKRGFTSSRPAPLERRGLVLFAEVPAHSPPGQKSNSKRVLLLNILPAWLCDCVASQGFFFVTPATKKLKLKEKTRPM